METASTETTTDATNAANVADIENTADTPKPAAPPAADTPAPKTDWVKEARSWENRAKANIEDAKRWKEYVEKVKPEQEKMSQELAQTRAELESLKLTNLKSKVAEEVGLPLEAVGRLQGNTEDELKADAESLKALFGLPSSTAGKPKPNALQGVTPSTAGPAKATTAEEYLRIVQQSFRK